MVQITTALNERPAHAPRTQRIPVAVLGATGSVGQRFVQLLEHHPWFRLHEAVASERSARSRTLASAADAASAAASLARAS